MEMAFRTEARIGAILIAAAMLAEGQTVEVRHRHLHKGANGELRITAHNISFTEWGKDRRHSRVWKYEDIQHLELTPDVLRILTYEDQKWKLGLDREYVFDRLPDGFAEQVYRQWKDRLDQRFFAGVADPDVRPLWQAPVKLTGLFQGSEGMLLVGAHRLSYRSKKTGESRTWRFVDIENIASANAFDLSVVTREREFRFQLKERLALGRYDELWRRLNSSREPELVRTAVSEE
jgi:hypothetical protein